jgi:hypothetical protein
MTVCGILSIKPLIGGGVITLIVSTATCFWIYFILRKNLKKGWIALIIFFTSIILIILGLLISYQFLPIANC